MEIRLTKQRNQFVAFDHISAEEMDAISDGQFFTAKLKVPRNINHHRKFFALLNVVYPNQSEACTSEDFLDNIKIGIGHCTWKEISLQGFTVKYPKPKSISFEKMGQPEFNVFYDKAMDYIVQKVIPGADRADLEREVQAKLV